MNVLTTSLLHLFFATASFHSDYKLKAFKYPGPPLLLLVFCCASSQPGLFASNIYDFACSFCVFSMDSPRCAQMWVLHNQFWLDWRWFYCLMGRGRRAGLHTDCLAPDGWNHFCCLGTRGTNVKRARGAPVCFPPSSANDSHCHQHTFGGGGASNGSRDAAS